MAVQWFPICSRSIYEYLWVSIRIKKSSAPVKFQCGRNCCPTAVLTWHPAVLSLSRGHTGKNGLQWRQPVKSVFSGTTHVSNVWSQIEQYSPISTPRYWGAKQSESRLCHQCVHRYNCTPVWVCLRIALVPVPHYKPSSFLIVTITNSVLS